MSLRVPGPAWRVRRPVVVKLGGSLAESGRLTAILAIVGAARAPIVIVPGGGSFADAVRNAQSEFGFSDAAAHRMALLAMHQMGLMMAALQPRLEPVETLSGIKRALTRGTIPVWLPYKLIAPDRLVAASWSTTSDALAARLAERLGRASVVLVKSCRVARGGSIAALTRARIVDPAFGGIVARGGLPWRVLGVGDEEALAGLVDARVRGSHRRLSADASRRAGSERAIARRR